MASELPKDKQVNGQRQLTLNQVTKMKDRLTRIESFVKQAATLMAIETKRVEEFKQSFQATVAALEAQLKEKEEIIQRTEFTLKDLEENLSSKTHALENQLEEREKLLEIREAELKESTSRGKEMEALAAQEA